MTVDAHQGDMFLNCPADENEVEIVEQKSGAEGIKTLASLEETFKATLQSYPDKQYSTIEVTRNNIVERTFESLEDENIEARVIVKLIGEEAVDTGGVMREYFSELFRGFLKYNTLVRGQYPNITFQHNLDSLEKGTFKLFGKLVAVALVNGCPGPHFFCPLLAGYLLDVEKKPTLDEIPKDCEFLGQIRKVSESCDEESFAHAVNGFPERFDMDYTKAVVKLQDKDELVSACIKHVVISIVAEEIYSFKKGLSQFGVLESLRKFPESGILLLMHCEVSFEDVKGCFKPVYSLLGSEIHSKEIEITYKWHRFLKRVSKGQLQCMVRSLLSVMEDTLNQSVSCEGTEAKVLSLSDVLQFGSGSRYPNFGGELRFDNDVDSVEGGKRVIGDACSCIIVIPVNSRYCCDTSLFCHNLMEGIFESQGFGRP